jgi:virginiamycin B lyase
MTARATGARTGVLRLAIVCAAALVLTLAIVTQAQAGIYWANYGSGGTGGTIGRANSDGSATQQNFIAGAAGPVGVVVVGPYIYWSNPSTQNSSPGTTIGRANLDGTGVSQNFITTAKGPHSLASDGSYLYWDNRLDGTIGRAKLDGTSVNDNFITGAGGPWGIATDSSFIYWTNFGEAGGSGGTTIGRAKLDGSEVNESFITGASAPAGIAVNASYIYWANMGPSGSGTTIGRANLNGTGANESFITGASTPGGIALDAASVYWSNASPLGGAGSLSFGGSTIGRASLDGTNVNQSFITGASSPLGVYADAAPLLYPPAPPPPPSAAPAGTLKIGATARVTRGAAGIRLSCVGGTCSGKLTITVKRRVRRRIHGHLKFVNAPTSVASARYSVAAGQSTTLSVKLSKVGAKLVHAARKHTLRSVAAAKPDSGVTVTQIIALTARR